MCLTLFILVSVSILVSMCSVYSVDSLLLFCTTGAAQSERALWLRRGQKTVSFTVQYRPFGIRLFVLTPIILVKPLKHHMNTDVLIAPASMCSSGCWHAVCMVR